MKATVALFMITATSAAAAVSVSVYGGIAYPLAAGLSVDLTARWHWIPNGGTYEITIHERYGYDPYYYSEYVFGTPLYKTYDDQFVEVSLGLAYGVP